MLPPIVLFTLRILTLTLDLSEPVTPLLADLIWISKIAHICKGIEADEVAFLVEEGQLGNDMIRIEAIGEGF